MAADNPNLTTWHQFAPVKHAGMPDFAEAWFGTTMYPTGRGTERPLRGWTCSGCGHGYSPFVRECSHCPEPREARSPEAGAACTCCPEDG